MFNCKICHTESLNIRKLSKHIRDYHKDVDVKTYYDDFLKKVQEGICLICKKETKYSGLSCGYKETCCKSCATKLFRIRLKQDPNKFDKFVQKISDSVKKEWSTNDQSDRIKNMTRTIRTNIEKMSSEEKKEKYGFLNKLPENEKLEMIKIMTENGFLKWWKNATYEQKRNAWDKRNEKLIELWKKCGLSLHKKQKETYIKRLKDDDIPKLTKKQEEKLFNNLDKLFNV